MSGLSIETDVSNANQAGGISKSRRECQRFDVAATVRASFGLYTDKSDIDALVQALGAVREIFD